MKLTPEEEREWRLQERALADARNGIAGGDDPMLAQYRSVARALQHAPPVGVATGMPANLTASVLNAVRTAPASVPAGLEHWLLRGLFAVLAVSGLAAAALYGGQWLQGFMLLWSQTSATGQNWLLALGACIAMSWSLRQLRWPHAQSNLG